MAADVFCTKPESTSSDQRKICIARTEDGSLMPAGGLETKARIPIIRSGAVSPSALAMPMIVPVKIPGIRQERIMCNTAVFVTLLFIVHGRPEYLILLIRAAVMRADRPGIMVRALQSVKSRRANLLVPGGKIP